MYTRSIEISYLFLRAQVAAGTFFMKYPVSESYGRTALMYAARNGHNTVVSALLSYNASLDIKDDYKGMTALMYAALNGHTYVVSTLLGSKPCFCGLTG